MRQLNFHNRYGMPVLGIQRHGAALHEPMHDTQLAPADILLVNGPGGYRFSDFMRVGGPLNLLMSIVATCAIPVFFPF